MPIHLMLTSCANIHVSEHKTKRDAGKTKAPLKILGSNRAMADTKDGMAAYLTAENLGAKVTVLPDTGSDYSEISRSAAEDARQRGFLLKVKVLPEPIMLSMAIGG
jgi:hypothetical protein